MWERFLGETIPEAEVYADGLGNVLFAADL